MVETEDLSRKDVSGQRPGGSMRQAMKLEGQGEGHQVEGMRL